MNCPQCNSNITMEVGPERPLSASLVDTLITAEEDEQVDINRDCWQCGWREKRSVRLETIEITNGDTHVVERSTLMNEIMNELETIESLTTLRDALAEVRRQRRLETAASGASTGDADDE